MTIEQAKPTATDAAAEEYKYAVVRTWNHPKALRNAQGKTIDECVQDERAALTALIAAAGADVWRDVRSALLHAAARTHGHAPQSCDGCAEVEKMSRTARQERAP